MHSGFCLMSMILEPTDEALAMAVGLSASRGGAALTAIANDVNLGSSQIWPTF